MKGLGFVAVGMPDRVLMRAIEPIAAKKILGAIAYFRKTANGKVVRMRVALARVVLLQIQNR